MEDICQQPMHPRGVKGLTTNYLTKLTPKFRLLMLVLLLVLRDPTSAAWTQFISNTYYRTFCHTLAMLQILYNAVV